MRILILLLFFSYSVGAQRLATYAGTKKSYPVKNEVDVYIVAGQSNAQGDGVASSLPSDLQATLTGCKIFKNNTFVFEDITAGTNTYGRGSDASGAGGLFGVEVKLGKLLLDYGKRPYFIKLAEGSSMLGNGSFGGHGNWSPLNTTGTPTANYYDLKKLINRALAEINRLGFTPRIRAFVWMQGEADANDATFYSAYQANLEQFIQGMRDHVSLPNMPFIIGRINAVGYTYRTNVRADEVTVGSEPNCYWIDTDSYPQTDGLHYSYVGLATGTPNFGQDIFNICKDF